MNDWNSFIADQKKQAYFNELENFLSGRKQEAVIYPPEEERFEAFRLSPLAETKVVILGQDPYHGEGQAHGLSFSVKKDMKIPPSLRNIYKELQSDQKMEIPSHGNLSSWARQGVLLLNTVLTVEKGSAGSHQKRGWENFTDAVIDLLNTKENLVFILWGSPAQKKGRRIDKEKHFVLEAFHPSPLSAYRGFFGCAHFSKANDYLSKNGNIPIQWDSILNETI